MVKKLIFSCIAASCTLFGGGDLSLQLSLQRQISPPIEQSMAYDHSESVDAQSVIVFNAANLKQGVDSPDFPDFASFGITEATVKCNTDIGTGVAIVRLPDTITHEAATALYREMYQCGFTPEKRLAPDGSVWSRWDGGWKLQTHTPFSPLEAQTLQSFAQQLTPNVSVAGPASAPQTATVTLGTREAAQASGSITYNRRAGETAGWTIGNNSHFGVTCSVEKIPCSPEQIRAIQIIKARYHEYQSALNRQETDAYTTKDAETVFNYKQQVFAGESSQKEVSVADARYALNSFEQLLRNEGIDPSDPSKMSSYQKQTLQDRMSDVYAAESRSSQQKIERVEHCIYQLEKLRLKQQHTHKQKGYETEIAKAKDEIFAEYYSEYFFNHYSESSLHNAYKDNQKDVAAAENVVKKCKDIVGKAGQDALAPRVNLANAQFNLDIEKGKQQILENLLQRITFTPAYKNNLITLQQKLESTPQGTLTASGAQHLAAVKETLATNGAVHKADVKCSPQVV